MNLSQMGTLESSVGSWFNQDGWLYFKLNNILWLAHEHHQRVDVSNLVVCAFVAGSKITLHQEVLGKYA
jgi:hypothetical protein